MIAVALITYLSMLLQKRRTLAFFPFYINLPALNPSLNEEIYES